MPVAEIVPPEIYGPFAGIVILAVCAYVLGRVVTILWREHMADLERDQADLVRERDRAARLQVLLDQALKNNADSISAWNKRNEQDAARQRRGDGRP